MESRGAGSIVALLLATSIGGAADEPASKVTVAGVLTGEGVECQALRGNDGKLYALTGALAELGAGDRVLVEGEVAEISFCMQGTTIIVRSIKKVK